LCEISYTGNGVSGDSATYTAITINSSTHSSVAALSDFSSLEQDTNQALSEAGGGSVAVLVSKTNEGDIDANGGSIRVYLQIIYPSINITSASIDLVINEVPQTFNFDKIPNV